MGQAKDLISKFNPWQIVTFTMKMNNNFGTKFTLLLSSVYYLVKGAAYYYAKDTLLPYTDRIEMSGQNYQLNSTIASAPWSMKGFIGVISDSFALFGYEKKWYMIITTILGTVGSALLIVLPYDASRAFFLTPGLLLFFVHLEGSTHDLLCEGKYVEMMRQMPHTKGDVVTYIWFCQTIGSLVPALTVGPMSDFLDPRYIFIIVAVCSAQPLIFLFSNCMVNDKATSSLVNRINTEKWKKEWLLMLLAIILGCLVLVSVIIGVIYRNNSMARFIYALISAAILVVLAFLMMPPIIAKGNLYIFLIRTLYLNLTGALDRFYIAEPECVEDGPNFSFTFYRTYTSLLSNFFNLVGLYFFQLYISKWNFRPAFWVTTVMRAIASLFDIILVNRWNKQIGIPDELLYLIGNAAILETVYMLDFMPMNLLIAKLCPNKVETTMYAILAGYMNYGASLSSHIGIWITDLLNIDTVPSEEDGTPCNFSNLTWLILIGHFILPLLSVPFTFWLIPNGRVDDDILTFKSKQSPSALARITNEQV